MTTAAEWWARVIGDAAASGARFHLSTTWQEAVAEFNGAWIDEPARVPPPVLALHPVTNPPAALIDLAAAERHASVCAVYAVLHDHPRSRRWHGTDETWESLRTIQSLGHEIALHVDPYDLARRRGSLLEGIVEQLAIHREAGLEIRAASIAVPHREGAAFPVTEFFTEFASGDGNNSPFADQRGSVPLRVLAEEEGLMSWLDDRLLAVVPMYRVSASQHIVKIVANTPTSYLLCERSGEDVYDVVPPAAVLDSAARVSSTWTVAL